MSKFAFLQNEWSAVHKATTRAEGFEHSDPRAPHVSMRGGLGVGGVVAL